MADASTRTGLQLRSTVKKEGILATDLLLRCPGFAQMAGLCRNVWKA